MVSTVVVAEEEAAATAVVVAAAGAAQAPASTTAAMRTVVVAAAPGRRTRPVPLALPPVPWREAAATPAAGGLAAVGPAAKTTPAAVAVAVLRDRSISRSCSPPLGGNTQRRLLPSSNVGDRGMGASVGDPLNRH